MLKNNLFVLNLWLHSEEAAEVGGIGLETPANDSQAPETTQEPVVVYGKPPEDSTEATESSTATAETPVDERAAKYAELKAEYKDMFESDFKSNLNRRMKNHTAEISRHRGITDPLLQYFGLPDMNALNDFVQNDIIPAIEGGYVPSTDSEAIYGNGDSQGESEAMPSKADLVIQSTTLVEMLEPLGIDLDLEAEMQNEEVTGYLKHGLDLEQAYKLAHFDELVLKETQKAAAATKQQTIEAIRTKGINHVSESVTRPQPQVVHKTDPSKFTDKDLDEIKRRLQRGEEIRF